MNNSVICSNALARLFSSSVVNELATKGKSATVARLLRESGLLPTLDLAMPISQVYETAFEYLKARKNRHEYIYKAAITQKILLGVHNLNTASMLTEFRVGNCKADVVVLNGTGTVYEIKSERDSLTRLQNQIATYLKVFETVNVIVGQNHLDKVLASTLTDVGVMVLSDAFTISKKREAFSDTSRICPLAVFECMNLFEAESVLRINGITIPQVPNTKRYGVLKNLFRELSPLDAHEGMVDTLKQTRNLIPLTTLLDEVPASLYSATLTTKIRRKDHERYSNSLTTTLTKALCWG